MEVLLRELYLIRHGETYGNIGENESDSMADCEDTMLTPNGEDQAERLGRYLKDTDFAAVYSGGLRRAIATADHIVKYREKKEILVLPPLCEIGINPGYKGIPADELSGFCKNAVIAHGYENSPLTIPDETPQQNEERYFARAKEVLDYISERYSSGEKVALVSHAGFLTYIIFYIIGYRDKQPYYDFRLGNTGVTRILFYEPGTNPYGDIVFDCVNDRSHLV